MDNFYNKPRMSFFIMRAVNVLSIHVFVLSVISSGNIHISQDCRSVYFQLEEHQTEHLFSFYKELFILIFYL